MQIDTESVCHFVYKHACVFAFVSFGFHFARFGTFAVCLFCMLVCLSAEPAPTASVWCLDFVGDFKEPLPDILFGRRGKKRHVSKENVCLFYIFFKTWPSGVHFHTSCPCIEGF